MRPDLLTPLFASASHLEGIGPKTLTLLTKLTRPNAEIGEEARILDVLTHLPDRIVDRGHQPPIDEALEGEIVTLKLNVSKHLAPPRHKRNLPYRVQCYDASSEITLTFFHANAAYLEKQLPLGETRFVSGKIGWHNGSASMIHPDFIAKSMDDIPLVEPIYPMTGGLSPKTYRKAAQSALAKLPQLPEWLDENLMKRESWVSFGASLEQLHTPQNTLDFSQQSIAWRRIAYDEFLASQLAIALLRQRMTASKGRAFSGGQELKAKILESLPYQLTNSQAAAVAEIEADIATPERMLRLLQGDVGAGKTIVALLSMLPALAAGAQGAMMAPTEILARQHMASITPLAEKIGMQCAVLTGREKGKTREELRAKIAAGDIQIVFGTHALFQSGVEFADLGLAVIDEQHRFGVHQRLALTNKGVTPDVLLMTATPIPRTLVLTFFGDMEVSKLTEKPPGRQPIQTNALSLDRLNELAERLRQAVARGDKAYWICPLVEENDELDLTSAEERFEWLCDILGAENVGLMHGRMKPQEKDEAMAAFKQSHTKVLVATTVVEVGVDVPDASIIIIEHAERFGLSQLHQLRGRVGRGDKASSCLLLYKPNAGATAQARINIMRETNDGFVIAEEDLKLRGEGEILGTRQSGTPGFKIADTQAHGELLQMARDDAKWVINQDPKLSTERGKALKVLLYLFGRDEAVRLLQAG